MPILWAVPPGLGDVTKVVVGCLWIYVTLCSMLTRRLGAACTATGLMVTGSGARRKLFFLVLPLTRIERGRRWEVLPLFATNSE